VVDYQLGIRPWSHVRTFPSKNIKKRLKERTLELASPKAKCEARERNRRREGSAVESDSFLLPAAVLKHTIHTPQ
jgi:hypothetical protein